ncbi:hypothetical protein [Paenibacillus sp. 481]|uniref:hypothetical protein n=1 Tax=Paenibacillus sp. 481 TaxID=2835869 RepID=UPI001E47B164|nr:hypothetical protein [Paenibacillus sp. 481]UHA74559.1 hypothetical protein KIK04_05525 [Paenibacillus sp. 481]
MKKRVCMTLLLGMSLLISSVASARPASFQDTEPNNTKSQANVITAHAAVSGSFKTEGDIVDYFAFTAPKSGKLLIILQPVFTSDPYNLHLEDADKTLASDTADGSTELRRLVKLDVEAGKKYYIKVDPVEKPATHYNGYHLSTSYLQ